MTEENGLAQQGSSVQLFEAVENGSIEDVQKLIDAGADVSIQNKNGNTPLHRAVIHRNIKDITALIRADKNVINITNNNGEIALHLAVDPLHPSEETRNQLTLIIEKLIEGGANVNANDIYGKTALQLACDNDFSQAVKILIENGADPNELYNLVGYGGSGTALHYAVLNGDRKDVLEAFASAPEVDVNTRGEFQVQEEIELQKRTPLFCAALYSRREEAKILLENDADPNIKLEDSSYEIMSTGKILSSQFLYAIALYSNNLDEKLIEQIKAKEEFRDIFETGEKVRKYVNDILLNLQEVHITFDQEAEDKLKKFLEDEDVYPFKGNSVLDFYELKAYIKEHVLIDGKRYTKKHVFLHNNKIIIDILSEVYGRRLQGMSGYELDEFIRESDKKFKDICDIGLINTLFDFDISKLNVIVPTLHQLAYVEVLRLLENNRHEELRYSFGKFIKTQEAHIREQNSEEAFNDIRYLYEEADEKVDTKLKAPIRDPVIPSEGAKKLEQSPQAYPKKPKSNSKYYYIGVFIIAGLAIGLIAAYIAGAPEVVFIVAAVAGMLIGAAFGVGIDYGISKCFANPNVEAHNQPGLVSHQ